MPGKHLIFFIRLRPGVGVHFGTLRVVSGTRDMGAVCTTTTSRHSRGKISDSQDVYRTDSSVCGRIHSSPGSRKLWSVLGHVVHNSVHVQPPGTFEWSDAWSWRFKYVLRHRQRGRVPFFSEYKWMVRLVLGINGPGSKTSNLARYTLTKLRNILYNQDKV